MADIEQYYRDELNYFKTEKWAEKLLFLRRYKEISLKKEECLNSNDYPQYRLYDFITNCTILISLLHQTEIESEYSADNIENQKRMLKINVKSTWGRALHTILNHVEKIDELKEFLKYVNGAPKTTILEEANKIEINKAIWEERAKKYGKIVEGIWLGKYIDEIVENLDAIKKCKITNLNINLEQLIHRKMALIANVSFDNLHSYLTYRGMSNFNLRQIISCYIMRVMFIINFNDPNKIVFKLGNKGTERAIWYGKSGIPTVCFKMLFFWKYCEHCTRCPL